jgi:glutathione-regulated potassium-efflux system ancillary protein KefC
MQGEGFLHQALIYLAAGVIAVPVFKRLGLGSVLGYLVAGMAIGPWGFSFVSRPETVLHFAEIGVVLLLFLVGLELNPRRVWELRKPIFGMGALQVIATVAIITAAGWALGLNWRVALVAGMGLAMSSTAVGLASLQEKKLLGTPGGQASFSVLLFQDLAVIPLLLLVGFMQARGSEAGLDWNWVISAVSMVIAIVVAGRLLLRPVLRYIANTSQREIFVGFALLLVIGVATLMELVGLSTALGAFIGGVLLADSEYRHEMELDIEPFKGLLLGLFFMAVGMSVDLGLFLRSPLLILGIVLGLLALKMLVLYPAAQFFGYCGRGDATLFAIALSQAGEFAFVLFGAAGNLLPKATHDLLTAVVAVSMLSTPLLMLLYERVLAPRFNKSEEPAPEAIPEQNPVIIAGFGRFGQVVARVLDGLKVGRTIVDIDPNQIEALRRFGGKAYYGDATRLNLLISAGAQQAKLLVVAVDTEDSAMRIVKLARKHFPQLKLIVRARGRTDAFEYHELGVPAVRETFGSALDAAELALRALDHGPLAARRVVARFRRHDEELLAEQAPLRNETKRLIAVSLRGRADLDRLLTSEALKVTPKPAK